MDQEIQYQKTVSQLNELIAGAIGSESSVVLSDFQNRALSLLVDMATISSSVFGENPSQVAESALGDLLLKKIPGSELLSINNALTRVSEAVVVLLQRGIIPIPTRIYSTPIAIEQENIILQGLGTVNTEETLDSQRGFSLGQAPKLQKIINVCLNKGINFDMISIFEETLEKNQIRKLPYRILYIPTSYGIRTVCVSDEIGEMTYVYGGEVDLGSLAAAKKGTSIQGYDTYSVRYSDSYEQDFQEVVFSDAATLIAKTGSWINRAGLQTDTIGSYPDKVLNNLRSRLLFQSVILESRLLLESAGIFFENGVWYFGDAQGANKWPKIQGKHLASFPSRKWNLERGITHGSGSISNSIELSKMFHSLGLRVATEEEERARWASILIKNTSVLESVGIICVEGIWYFGDAKGMNSWPKVGLKNLQSYPSATYNRKLGIGGAQAIISSLGDLVIMFHSLGLRVATEEEERARWASILIGNANTLEQAGIFFENGVWYFGDIKGVDNWPKISGKKLSYFPNIVHNQRNGVGNEFGIVFNPIAIAAMFRSLGLRVATEEEERARWASILIGNANLLEKSGICYSKDTNCWDFSRAKGLKKQPKIQGRNLGSFPRVTYNKQRGIGNEEGMLQSIEQVQEMFKSLGFKTIA